MLNEKQQQFNKILQGLADGLNIPPRKFKQAMARHDAVKRHLNSGVYAGMGGSPKVYLQGSFRLGTVVRPLKDDEEGDYDVDLVCEFPVTKDSTTAKKVKTQVGDRLRKYADHDSMLDDEGSRCWTLEYAERDDIGFHIDILPSATANDSDRRILNERKVPSLLFQFAIDLTEKDKDTGDYSWKFGGSNPEGFAAWFDNKKTCYPDYMQLSLDQKQAISESTLSKEGRRIFAHPSDVPEALVRTPLQSAIQILKRHRDSYFVNNPDNKPISMIITTLSTRLYDNEKDIISALENVIQKTSAFAQYLSPSFRYSENAEEIQGMVDSGDYDTPIIDKPIFKLDGKWYIPNPVNPGENFADRWDDNKAAAFFEWLDQLRQDFDTALQQEGFHKISGILSPIFGSRPVKSAFVDFAQSAKIDIDNKMIKTTPKTGILSSKGSINTPKHSFYS